jgi:Sec-independent protein secretion pathway component TatC
MIGTLMVVLSIALVVLSLWATLGMLSRTFLTKDRTHQLPTMVIIAAVFTASAVLAARLTWWEPLAYGFCALAWSVGAVAVQQRRAPR